MNVAHYLRGHFPKLFWWAAAALVALTTLVPATAVQFNTERLLQSAQKRYGQRGADTVSAWLASMQQARSQPVSVQLQAVNRFWNSNVRGVEDIDLWGQADYWATPLETLGKRAGDCEDYVIGKYFSLLHIGVPAEKLRLIYVRARVGGQTIAHMVLGYYETPSSDPLILDSLTSTMVTAARRPDLTPVFSFNAQGIYVAGQARSVESISRWQDLLGKMRNEGIDP
ncbi:MAG TPA: transglutaminase-like cysteine peptidase [Pusillimonas sp.]|uniref:transglutaminase-like cysteine peptidase n=1 Tax=Pusillimonas sp. TaxID=3040095 RepID=UPI002B6A049A|nr:transglutaminase-like cysteine peptidase [Pusillimonas sp.]HUH87713.1 transglutaminase-like cysteine peptidase [Pusillimonas sp.]